MIKRERESVRLSQPGFSSEASLAGNWEKEGKLLELIWYGNVLTGENFGVFVEGMLRLIGGEAAHIRDNVNDVDIYFSRFKDERHDYGEIEFMPKSAGFKWSQNYLKDWEKMQEPVLVETIRDGLRCSPPKVRRTLWLPPNAQHQIAFKSSLNGQTALTGKFELVDHMGHSSGTTMKAVRKALFAYAHTDQASNGLKVNILPMARNWNLEEERVAYSRYNYSEDPGVTPCQVLKISPRVVEV